MHVGTYTFRYRFINFHIEPRTIYGKNEIRSFFNSGKINNSALLNIDLHWKKTHQNNLGKLGDRDRSGNTNYIFQLCKFSFLNILLIWFLEYLLYIIWQIHTCMFIIYLNPVSLQFPFPTSLTTLNHPSTTFLSFLFTHWVQSVTTSRMLTEPVGLGSSCSVSDSCSEFLSEQSSHVKRTAFHSVPSLPVALTFSPHPLSWCAMSLRLGQLFLAFWPVTSLHAVSCGKKLLWTESITHPWA